MKKILIGIILVLIALLAYKSCTEPSGDKRVLQESSMLIQQQIQKVSKLIVTEGHFAEIYNYKDSKELFGPLLTADKKALVVVNAEVSIAYDLSKINFDVDEKNKTLTLKNIPEPEIKINPDFEYYNVSADFFNPFDAEDYNTIKRNTRASLLEKVEASTLPQNAKNRLIAELSDFLLLTQSLGWILVYNESPLENIENLRLDEDSLID